MGAEPVEGMVHWDGGCLCGSMLCIEMVAASDFSGSLPGEGNGAPTAIRTSAAMAMGRTS